jgi:hypothetical protein
LLTPDSQVAHGGRENTGFSAFTFVQPIDYTGNSDIFVARDWESVNWKTNGRPVRLRMLCGTAVLSF